LKIKRTLLFESCSILHTICLWKEIKAADLIFYFGNTASLFESFPLNKKMVLSIVQFLNPRVTIRNVPHEIISKYSWTLNKECLKLVDDCEATIRESSLFQLARNLLGDEKIINYYKMRLAQHIPARFLFSNIAAQLCKQHKDLYVIPTCEKLYGLEIEILHQLYKENLLPERIKKISRLDQAVKKVCLLFLLTFFPLVFILSRIKKIRISVGKKRECDVRLPVIWGIRDDLGKLQGIKRPQSDEYLYNEHLKLGQIIHVFGDWKINNDVEQEYKRLMNKYGYSWVDKKTYSMDVRFLKITANTIKTIMQSLFKHRLHLNNPIHILEITIRILNHYLDKQLEHSNLDYNVEFIRDDYNAKHVVATILCHANNKKTVGTQHVAIPHIAPYLSYVHFDKYLVYGDLFLKHYLPYWNELNLEKTGRETIDWVANILLDRKKKKDLNRRLKNLYPERKFTAVIILPSGSERNKKEQWDKIYNALHEMSEMDIDLNLFLRFRSENDLHEYDHLRRFKRLAEKNSTIHIDHDNFTTYELIVLSELVIANSASFAINEAIITNAKVFSFEFLGFTKYYFPNYGNDFILNSKEDLLRVLRGLENNFEGFDCNWDNLKKDCNYHCDGNNLKRIQKVVVDTVSEVENARP